MLLHTAERIALCENRAECHCEFPLPLAETEMGAEQVGNPGIRLELSDVDI
jgi:hypothetical protein